MSTFDELLAAVSLVSRVLAAGPHGNDVGALEELGVHDPGRGQRIPPGRIHDRGVQGVMDSVAGAVGVPVLEAPVRGVLGREVVRHHPPRAPGAVLTLRIVSAILRREWIPSRPPVFIGTIGAIGADCASVTSVG
jgi:hypothetical protein